MKRFALVLVTCMLAGLLASCGDQGPRVVAYFEDAGDAVVGGQVQISDVPVGTIDSIDMVVQEGRMVARVEMSLEPDVELHTGDLGAIVRQTSLLGEQFIELVPSNEGPELNTAEVTIPLERTTRRVDIETFLGDLSAFVGGGGLEDLNRFTNAQAIILENRGETFGRVIDELTTFTGTLAGRRVDVGQAIDNLASASETIVNNQRTLDDFLDSLEDANALLAEQGEDLRALFQSLSRFGRVNASFLARHESAIERQIRALRPIFRGLAGAKGELDNDLVKLRRFFKLFPKSLGTGPGGRGAGDYIQVDGVLCERLVRCNTRGEKGDVPGQGSRP
jgi:phospholipid/cholesterol/gamma-HCH transport system substrate-binding protein